MSEIRSYRSVFELERRIYRIDRVRLNPSGVPVRGVVYWLAILAATLAAERVPLLGAAMRVLPWYIRALALPALLAAPLSMMRIEGRPFHLAAVALARYAIAPRHLCGLRPCAAPGHRWTPAELLVLPDGSGPRLRRLRYTGPGVVQQTSTGRKLVLASGQRLDVAPRRPPVRSRLRVARGRRCGAPPHGGRSRCATHGGRSRCATR